MIAVAIIMHYSSSADFIDLSKSKMKMKCNHLDCRTLSGLPADYSEFGSEFSPNRKWHLWLQDKIFLNSLKAQPHPISNVYFVHNEQILTKMESRHDLAFIQTKGIWWLKPNVFVFCNYDALCNWVHDTAIHRTIKCFTIDKIRCGKLW